MIHLHTNDWSDLGEKRIRRWPVAGDVHDTVPPEIAGKRPIDVEINSWVGMSLGAKHIYVKVTERDNEWWCEEKNAWVSIICDSEKGGYQLKADVMTESEAIKIAKYFIEIIAGKDRKNHEVNWDGPGKPKWAKL